MPVAAAAERNEFAPPPQRGTIRAVILALLAHALLIALLTWGVRWKRSAENEAVEAELWSSTVQQAAPRAVAPPPPPRPVPKPPTPAAPPPPPPPPAAVQPPPAPPAVKTPDIALEREKKLREQKEQREREQAAEQKRQQDKKKQEAAERAAQEKKDLEAKKQREEAERKKAEQQKQAEAQKAQAQKEAEAKKKAEAAQAAADAKKKAQAAQAAADAKQRQATIDRMKALAGEGGEGKAARASGPSGGYGAKVAAAVRPNVVFPDADLISGNPAAEFDVRLAPDGTIVGTPQMTKSSGNPDWDNAALRALQKTEKLPRDIDGTVPSRLIVSLRPKR